MEVTICWNERNLQNVMIKSITSNQNPKMDFNGCILFGVR